MLKKSKLGVRLDLNLKALSHYLNARADKVFAKLGIAHCTQARNPGNHALCTATGHPVDIATGKVFTDFVEFGLSGTLPFKLERIWYSTSTYAGPLGHGWQASFDMALADENLPKLSDELTNIEGLR